MKGCSERRVYRRSEDDDDNDGWFVGSQWCVMGLIRLESQYFPDETRDECDRGFHFTCWGV
jgi:hypothetical protein